MDLVFLVAVITLCAQRLSKSYRSTFSCTDESLMALCFPSCLRLPPAAFAVFGFHSPALAMSALTENAPLPAPFSLT